MLIQNINFQSQKYILHAWHLQQATVGVRKSAEGRAPVAMQLVQLLQLVFFDTTDATSATGATLSTILRIFVKETSKAKGKHTCGRWMSV